MRNDEDLIIKPATENKLRVIRQREEFLVDGLGKVVRLTVVNSANLIGTGQRQVEYEGYTVVGVPTPGGVYQVPVQFEIEANSVEEAFDKFEELAKAQFEKNMEEAERAAQSEATQVRAYSAMPPGIIQ